MTAIAAITGASPRALPAVINNFASITGKAPLKASSKRVIKKGVVNCLFKNTPLNTMMHPRIVKDDNEQEISNYTFNKGKGISENNSFLHDNVD